MNINVISVTSYLEPISITVDGECNHALVDIEQEEFDTPNPHGQDLINTEAILVCRKCKAWRSDYEDEWHGVTVLPN